MIDELRGKNFPILDDGFVRLIDCMGSDEDILDAARISFGRGTMSVSSDRDLVRYLMRHQHSTPFEMAEIKLHVRVPMDCWRQWIRHRTANVNEYSTRYSEAIESCQGTAPGDWRLQSATNRQGSSGIVEEWPEDYLPSTRLQEEWLTPGKYLTSIEGDFQLKARHVYEERLRFGVAREQARKDLPLSTYTEAVWKCDLRNVLGFLSLRMDGHAQLEIRQYANVIGNKIVAKLFPLTWEAFRDYSLNAVTLSGPDCVVAARIATGGDPTSCVEEAFPNKRERAECLEKLARLGLHGRDLASR